jgi:hypothetical protein
VLAGGESLSITTKYRNSPLLQDSVSLRKLQMVEKKKKERK